MEARKLIDTLAVFDKAQGSITLSDAMSPEMPLIYANTGFEIISGYKRNADSTPKCIKLTIKSAAI